MNKTDLAAMIQYSLTPGIMISSSALFLLGIQTRFSNLFSRFRVLNQERRSLEQGSKESVRVQNIVQQLDRLTKRIYLVKNAIFCLYFAIIAFIATCLCLFFAHSAQLGVAQAAAASFIAGMLFILAAVIFLLREVSLAAHILQLEQRT